MDLCATVRMLSFSPWGFLPPFFSVFTAAGLWLVYFVALQDGRILPLGSNYSGIPASMYPPYISIAGNSPPASCIFSEVMNLSAFMGFIIAVLRYVQLKKHRLDKQWLNIVSLAVFCIACFGMTVVGNFQPFRTVHNIGTFMTFGLGTLFCWMQSVITLRVNIKNEGRVTGLIRSLLSGCVSLCLILYLCLMPPHLDAEASQVQWSLVMFFLLFIGTFAIEFRHDRFTAVCLEDSDRLGNQLDAVMELKYQPLKDENLVN